MQYHTTKVKLKLRGIKTRLIGLVIVGSLLSTHTMAQSTLGHPKITVQQAKALNMLDQRSNRGITKTLDLQISKLSDNQGQVYLGAIISRAQLLSYLTQLKGILKSEYQVFRSHQAARDHHSFHMTLLSPKEYQLADTALVEKLLGTGKDKQATTHLTVTLLGLAKVEQDNKSTFFVVAQSNEGQLLRQGFLLPPKDFHVTLGFNPTDIYGVKKDLSTLIDRN